MKKLLFIMFLGTLGLTSSCSTDEVNNSGMDSNFQLKNLAMCTNIDLLVLNCTSSSPTVNSPVTFTWNNNDLIHATNRTYQSYIQIESNGCFGTNPPAGSIPINVFGTSSYTLTQGRNETCFKYRIVILGYENRQLVCESISPWQVFYYF
jgi:hypothetical protein